jgi:ribosomal protein L37AE/L43A
VQSNTLPHPQCGWNRIYGRYLYETPCAECAEECQYREEIMANINICPNCLKKDMVSVGPEAYRCTSCGKFITFGPFKKLTLAKVSEEE